MYFFYCVLFFLLYCLVCVCHISLKNLLLLLTRCKNYLVCTYDYDEEKAQTIHRLTLTTTARQMARLYLQLVPIPGSVSLIAPERRILARQWVATVIFCRTHASIRKFFVTELWAVETPYIVNVIPTKTLSAVIRLSDIV